ncbi:hypothetical protein K9O30_14270 [Clostridium bowmanii]|uniref:hypothetical protein n=1 Tax=Clostridium bowmanii TaxID=132925 RepID=UPI001C0B45BD|nr:hypothetical protein [Clostridium bowmanii]MBU3190353.1 hypothetical protein [Clostridium bowmanii]MCA1074865.1 hypothetical protein [Clostridium bowmanii]
MSLYMFIASDFSMPFVDNIKTKYFKFKEGVKIDVDDEGIIYYYTNDRDRNSPDLLIPCHPEEADTIVADSEESLQEIQISKGLKCDYIEWYTNKSNIYTLDWRYTDKRANDLINYFKDNMKVGYEVELWSTWMDECKKPTIYYYDIDSLKVVDIEKVFNSLAFDEPRCMVISKTV